MKSVIGCAIVQRFLLYFGTPTGGLDCAVTVLESDEDVRRALGNVQSGVTRLAAAAGSVPGYGTAASAGLTLASGVIDLIRQCIDDDVELSYHGILDDDEQHDFAADLVEAGRYRLVRPNRDSMSVDEPDVKLDFTVHRFKPWQARGDREPQLAVVIDRIEIEPSEAIQKLENNENARLFFEATLGAGKAARSYSFQQSLANGQATLNRVFGLRHKRVYVGPYRMGVPLAMNLALVCDQAELQMIEGLASHAATFVGAIGDEEAKKMASQVTKGVQTVRSIVTEFLPQKISVGQVSKLLVTGQHGFPGGARPGCVLTVEDPSDWTRVNVELQSQTGGKATVILKVKAI